MYVYDIHIDFTTFDNPKQLVAALQEITTPLIPTGEIGLVLLSQSLFMYISSWTQGFDYFKICSAGYINDVFYTAVDSAQHEIIMLGKKANYTLHIVNWKT